MKSQRYGQPEYGETHMELFLEVIKGFDFKGKKVLDVGAGEGWCGREFEKLGAEVTSIDLKPGNDKILKRDVENMSPLWTGMFDFVNSHGTIHHTKHPFRAIQEIYRVLKDDGYLLMTEATLKDTFPIGFANRYILQYIILPFRDFDEWKNNGRMFFQREYDSWCRKVGFIKLMKRLHYSSGIYKKC